ncbi:MAG TPA: family 10 glycosylhydrolase, partial [Candidatus Obscuribacterales bacterium]
MSDWREAREGWRPLPYERIDQLLQSAGEKLKAGPGQDPAQVKAAHAELLEAQILMMPSRPVEFRGVLLDADSIGIDPVALGAMLDKLKAAGFNTVFPEVFRRGYALFPNRVAEVDPLYLKRGVDALQLVSQQAGARGMQVYPWLWTFRVFSPSTSSVNPIFERLPALVSPQLSKSTASENGEGLEDESAAFVSPAAPEWRELMALLVGDIARNYPVQGFLLDYIRYGNNATSDQLSQTAFNMDYFRRVGSFPPKPLDPASDLQAEWQLWREEQVHRMLQQLRLSTAEVRPGLSLGTAVFRNEVNARNTKMQNWRHWADNNWVDFVAPMMYANSRDQLDLWLDWESDAGSRRDMLYPILGLQAMRSPGELFNQIGLLQERRVPGFSLFGVRRLDARTLNWLQQGPFRQMAEAPHSNPLSAVRRQLLASADWLESLAKPENAKAYPLPLPTGTGALAAALRARAGSLDPAALESQLQELLDRNQGSGLPGGLQREIAGQLDYARALAGIQAEHGQPGGQRGGKLRPPTRPPSAVLAEARPLPQLQIPFLASAPTIDGQPDEPAWQAAAKLPALWWSTGSARPQVNTRIQLGYDSQALYLAWLNQEPRPDRIKASPGLDGSEQLPGSGDDTVEIFLSPGNQPKNYYYFVLNPANARFAKASFDSAWRADWEGLSSRSEQGWQAEIRIPFASLRVPAPSGGSWRGNLCRRRPQEIAPYHCWSMTFGGVHRIDRFGSLNFAP